MKNIKVIWDENKEAIVGTCVIVGGIVVATAIPTVILTRKHYLKTYSLIPKGKSWISWNPIGKKIMSLEEAKAFLDLNVDDTSVVAVVKDGIEYIGLSLSRV